MKVKEAIKLAESNGWTFIRTKGDHHIFTKPGHSVLVIPGKGSDDLKKGTEKSIVKKICET